MEGGYNNTTMDIIQNLTVMLSKIQSEKEILKEKVRKLTEENKEMRKERARSTDIARQLDNQNNTPHLTERKTIYSSIVTHDKVPSFVVSSPLDTTEREQSVKNEMTSMTNASSEVGPPAFNFQSTVNGSSEASWLSRLRTQLSTCTYDEEVHMHHSLCRAVSHYCEELTPHGYGTIDYEILDYLLQEGCITYEEHNWCLQQKNTCINVMRVIVVKMFRRDCKTLALFVGVQLECNGFKHIGEAIISQYEKYVREPKQSVHEYCCHCLLRTQVDICLIIDKLLQHDYRAWIPLYEKVFLSGNSERNQMFWDEFMAMASECGQSVILSKRLMEWLSDVGFHSDIVRKLRKDSLEACNSFLCKHLTQRKILASGENGLLDNLESIPGDSEELENATRKRMISENTALKQVVHVFENTTCVDEDAENKTIRHVDEHTTCKLIHEDLDMTTPKCTDAENQTVSSNTTTYQALPYITISHQIRNAGDSDYTTRICELKEFKISGNENFEMTACENGDFGNTAVENEDLDSHGERILDSVGHSV